MRLNLFKTQTQHNENVKWTGSEETKFDKNDVVDVMSTLLSRDVNDVIDYLGLEFQMLNFHQPLPC